MFTGPLRGENGAMPVDVLVVDDHRAFRSVARTVVDASPGFRLIAEAASGEAAVDLVHRLHPGLVLLDINMPGMGGIEAARQIMAGAPSTVVVLLSTYDADAIPAEAGRCGATRYVRKEDFGAALLADLLTTTTFPPGGEGT
jgi:DNA-binding NarL/FixJ family response regulator